MYGYQLFPNLTHLCIMNQNVRKIECLHRCPHLREIWVCETLVEKMEGFEKCKKIEHMYLYGNRISRIENLLHLSKLKTLSLADNYVARVEGLKNLKELLDLNLADNRIECIGDSLSANGSLVSLNLSGNPIISFDTLKPLKSLKFLTSLSLADAQYLASPLAGIQNYTTLVLFNFPRLKYLDHIPISEKVVKTAKEMIENKRMFYNLKVRMFSEAFLALRQELSEVEQFVLSRCLEMRQLATGSRAVLESLEDEDTRAKFEKTDFDRIMHSLCIGERREKLDTFQTCLDGVYDKLHTACDKAVTSSTDRFQLALSRLELEFSTAGNIEFIHGTSEQDWYRACVELVSPSPPERIHQFGIRGVSVVSVAQVRNPALHSRFVQRLLEISARQQRTRSNPNPTEGLVSAMDYLFLQWTPGMEQSLVHSALCRDGLPCLRGSKHSDYFIMTHSLYEADLSRLIVHSKENRSSEMKRGCVMLCKVFLGRSKSIKSLSDAKNVDFTAFDSAVVSKFSDVEDSDYIPTCYCDDQRLFIIPEHDVIVPEYLVSFEYEMSLDTHELINVETQGVLNCVNSAGSMPPVQVTINDSVFSSLYSQLDSVERIDPLSLREALQLPDTNTAGSITSLYLPACGVESLLYFNQFPNLTALYLAANRVSSLEGLVLPSLQYLDISHNSIQSIDRFAPHHSLHHLDLSWNSLTNLHSTLLYLKTATPSLLHISLQMNLFALPTPLLDVTAKRVSRQDWEAMNILVTFPDVQTINSVPIAEYGRIMSSIINKKKPKLPKECVWAADTSTELALFSPSNIPPHSRHSLATQDAKWHLSITTLKLQGRCIHSLPTDFNLPSLTRADLSHNLLTSLHGICNCQALRQLSMDWNVVQSLNELDSLPNLRELSCSHNRISTFPRLTAKHLQLISLVLNHNEIASLQNSDWYPSLLDLSLTANPIHSQREIFHLKHVQSLIVLNISDTEFVRNSTQSVRSFCLFHLPNLRCLDDELVRGGELVQARDLYGGKLTLSTICERIGHNNFSSLRELTLVNQSVKSLDLDPIESLDNLRSLNLESNQLTSLSGLLDLKHLKVLCLNSNKISSLSCAADADTYPVLPSLEVLQLASNGIPRLHPLQLHRLPALKALFLQNNELSSLEGVEEFPSLLELVLDRNKIKFIPERDLSPLRNILELHLEENRLKFLPELGELASVRKLFLGSNRVHELKEFTKLVELTFLTEVSFINNPVSRKSNYTSSLIQAVPHLRVIDGYEIPPEERSRALDELHTQWNPM